MLQVVAGLREIAAVRLCFVVAADKLIRCGTTVAVWEGLEVQEDETTYGIELGSWGWNEEHEERIV